MPCLASAQTDIFDATQHEALSNDDIVLNSHSHATLKRDEGNGA